MDTFTESSAWIVVLTTASSEAEAEKIGEALVDAGLAACVAIAPIRSIYRWQGEVCKETEWQLAIKTRKDAFSAIAQKVKDLHSYDVPELIALPIVNGSLPYLNWIDRQVEQS